MNVWQRLFKSDQMGYIMTDTNWGGKRSNQKGRPPLPKHKKRVRVATLLAPGSLEIAKAIAKELNLPGWGYVVDLALKQMAKKVLDK